MTRSAILALGLLALLGCGFLCVRRHGAAIEADLTERAQAALRDRGTHWAVVRAAGRDLTVSGLAPDGPAGQGAIELVGNVRGVRAVRDRIQIQNQAYSLRLRAGDGLVELVGEVPDEPARQSLLARASGLFDAEAVIDRMSIRAPAPQGWWEVADGVLAQLASCQSGEAAMTDHEVELVCTVASAESAGQIRAAIQEGLPPGFAGRARLTVPEPDERLAAETCQQLFDQLTRGTKLLFATGSSAIDPRSHELLDQLAATAKRCPQTAIEIGGHTDSRGDAELNAGLSQQRAEAVREYLEGAGVLSGRLTARGYGEARPIADNSTVEGRAANRRIEFKIRKE